MRKVIMWDMVTPEGFFEGPDHDLGWFVFDNELGAYIVETQKQAEVLLFGRITYEMMKGHWQGAEGPIADFMNSVEKVVFSGTLQSAEWNNTHLVRSDVPGEVRRLKAEGSGDIFVFGSAVLASTLMAEGLIDELRLGISPVLIGAGVPLLKGGFGRLSLELLSAKALKSGVVILHYAPRR
jgi:dihydrofolate reductase